MSFLNNDYIVTPGTLHAAKITIPELQKLIFERVKSLNSAWFESDVYENLPNVDAIKQNQGLVTAIKVLMFDDHIIAGDNVYELGSNDIIIPGCDENSNLAHDMYYHGGKFGEMLFGWQTLPNGLTFLGCSMAEGGMGDAFAIIYFDGQNLRLYIPVRGNRINTIYGTVLGSEYYDEAMAGILEAKSGVKNNGVNVGDIYANMYVPGTEVADASMHWDAIRDEIMQVITVDDAQPAQIPQKPAKSFAQNRAEQRALAKNAVIQDWLNLSDSNPNAAVSIRCDQGPRYWSTTTFTRKSGVITVDGEYAPHFTVYINAYKHLPDFLKRLADTMQDIFDVFEVLPMETAPEVATAPEEGTYMVKVDFNAGYSVYVSLPENIRENEDEVESWIRNVFNDVKAVHMNAPSDPEDENFGVIITTFTDDDTYEIFFPDTEPIYGEMRDEDVDKLDAWIDAMVNNVDYWENCTQEG